MRNYEEILNGLSAEGRLRTIPVGMESGLIDFSSNDYLGLSQRRDLAERFVGERNDFKFSSAASRLLASSQHEYRRLEDWLSEAYGKSVLLYNSGYHANVGAVSALASSDTLVISDRLVHASIIDGIVLSKAPFRRFRHNDMEQLRRIVAENIDAYKQLLVVTESIFSMDGDEVPLADLVAIKRDFPSVLLYVDEAHAIGVRGGRGLGVGEERGLLEDIDVLVGTFGKACGSMGAFVATSEAIRDYLVNSSRSFIFSTAIAPVNVEWTLFMMQTIEKMSVERECLKSLGVAFRSGLECITGEKNVSSTQIVPWIIGDSVRAVELSKRLRERGFLALPIRKPTVPAGTERIRFSLSAAMSRGDVDNLLAAIEEIV